MLFLLRKCPDIAVTAGSPAAQDRLAPVFTQPAAECAWEGGSVREIIFVPSWVRTECTQKKRENDS